MKYTGNDLSAQANLVQTKLSAAGGGQNVMHKV